MSIFADNSSTDGEDAMDDDDGEGEMTGMQLLLACAEGRTHSSPEARKVCCTPIYHVYFCEA